MPVLASSQLAEVSERIEHLVRDAVRRPTVEAFELIEQQVNRFDTQLREVHQSLLADDARSAMASLKSGRALSEKEQSVLRALVVGDAESYLHMENNLHEWQTELNRLVGEMKRLASSDADSAVFELRGVVRDAVRLLPSIRAYMDEKCRLDRFDRALTNLDKANRELLVQLVGEMLSSPTR